MRYLLFISGCLLFSCQSSYRNLVPAKGNAECIRRFRPEFSRVLYRTRCLVRGHEISGILLIKTMPDSSRRVVFSGETGFKFFDFEFSGDSLFRVYYIAPKLDKKAVVKTLRKDFELILWQHTDPGGAKVFSMGNLNYYRFDNEKGYTNYITDSSCTGLVRIERGTARKPVAEVTFFPKGSQIPDSIGITHRNFNMTIGLKRIEG